MTDSQRSVPERLFAAGYTDLISVIPPGAQLTPTSKIAANQVGKVPGRRLGNGLWAGYDWRRHQATADDVRQWFHDGASVGLRADRFPGVDIDCLDAGLAKLIQDEAIKRLGPAPIRIGRAPKRLLSYRTAEPFGRMRLWIEVAKDQHHLVEVLGMGQQYVVHGIHPSTGKPYEWDRLPAADELTVITREKAEEFLAELALLIDMLGLGKTEREGDGRPITHTAAANQKDLEAPSIELLRAAVELIPNTNEKFPDRTSYLKMGYAIRAAAGDNEADGLAIFSEWAARWEGNDRCPNGNEPEVVRQDWRRMRGQKAVGWSWIAEQARAHGFNDAALDFEADMPEPETPAEKQEENGAIFLSDQWLALKVVERRRQELRFVPQLDRWLVWTSSRWQPDAALMAEDTVKAELRKIAAHVATMGASAKEQEQALNEAKAICSQHKASAVRTLVQSDRAIALDPASLDHDSWVLNTPAGIVDLRTGKMMRPDPDQLCTKSTAVAPDFGSKPTRWLAFLEEATGGDAELQAYMKRLAGYALTGSTREQHLTFIWGPGGNGKGVYVNTIAGILADYARNASMDVFTASNTEKHSTDLAMLSGARLVTASETQQGKRWDEAKIKAMTGGDPITARFMRQDNFTYLPQFKLVFLGNHKPEIRDIDAAMRRRIHLVPFTVTPKVVDKELTTKLREEWPAILAWMIEGCLEWQGNEGLAPPPSVRAATEEYFAENDPVGQWIEERIELDPTATELSTALFASWQEWANRNGEYVGSLRRLVTALAARRHRKWKHPQSRQAGFAGLRIKPAEPIETIT